MTYSTQIKEVSKLFPDICVVTVFGSVVSGRTTPDSDIDIGVAGDRPLSFDQKTDLLLAFSRVLVYEVDLIDLQAVSGLILQQALCTGKVIIKDDFVYPALIKKMWFEQVDMMPLTRMVLERHCRRFANG
nr:nucleotidyltransferase domain-containing protein [Desulfobulbaceae bacterium]